MPKSGFESAQAVRDAVYRASLALDEFGWDDWLNLCDPDSFHYMVSSFSPEIGKNMIYLQGSWKEMKLMVDMLPKHNTDHSPLHRQTSVYTVDVSADGKTAESVSSFVIYQNLLDGINSHIDSGESRLFLVGKYHDQFKISDGVATFTKRDARLGNRRLDKGSHYPI